LDPISTLLSAYLEFVSNDIQETYSERRDVGVKSVVIGYKGTEIPFQHQLWKVRPASVCEAHRSNLRTFSECSVAAKEMFQVICAELSSKQIEHWKYVRTKSMYCNAAVEFKPTIASIVTAQDPTPLEAARQRCNIATAKALGSNDEKALAERNNACREYERTKAQ